MEAKTSVASRSENKEFQDKLQELKRFIDTNKPVHDLQGTLMGVLHRAQTVFGYIPREAMDTISEKLEVPTAHIYGMATFYNYFSLKPKGRYQIYTCKGTACYVGGGARILAKLQEELGIREGELTKDGLFSLNITRCLGCCGLSPVMQINEDVYVRMVPEKVPGIIAKYRKLAARLGKPAAKKAKAVRAK
jgi:NADH:ubiquinone oxidoreductase subunit E